MAEYNINIDRVGDDLNEAYDFGYESCMRDYHIKHSNEQQTNADRLRSMSDEELADFMAEIMYCIKCWKFDKEQGICTRASGCNSAMLEWLREETK